jgi:septal ring factor EnvC (AmiA/AmiB activator)
MKISNKITMTAAFLILFAMPVFCAEIVEDDTPTPVPTKKTLAAASKTAVPAKAAGTPAPAASQESATSVPTAVPTKKPEISASTVADIRQKLDDLSRAMKDLKDDIKSLEEKNIEAGSISADLDAYKKQLDTLEGKAVDDRKKIDSLSGQFTDIKDTLKDRIDKMQSWDDIMDVLKKEISNNEREIARLRKDIGELKKQYGREDNVFSTIAQWPYAGITALVVSLAAFIVVMVKR